MHRKLVYPLTLLIIASLACSLPGGILGPTLTPTPTQTLTPTSTTYSQYPYIEVPLQAVLVSDDDGSHAVQITYDEIKIWVDRSNFIYAPAGIRFLFQPSDMSQVSSTLLNNMIGNQDAQWDAEVVAGNAVAAQYPGKLTVFFRRGSGENWLGGAFSSYNYNFVVMPQFSDTWCDNQDDQGMLWIGTRSGGLNRYDPTTGMFTRFIHDPSDTSSLSSNNVQVILGDSRARLWIGTTDGLDLFQPETNGFIHYAFDIVPAFEPGGGKPSTPLGRPLDSITTLIEDDRGFIWVGTAYAGLSRYDDERHVFINYSEGPSSPYSLSSNTIRSVSEDPTGSLWVATDKGLHRYARGAWILNGLEDGLPSDVRVLDRPFACRVGHAHLFGAFS